MEQTIEKLCEKFGVTVENLVTELFKYHTAMGWTSLAIWFLVILVTVLLSLKNKDRWQKAFENDEWFVLTIAFPVAIGIVGIISIPYIIIDLIGWYVSPVASTLSILLAK